MSGDPSGAKARGSEPAALIPRQRALTSLVRKSISAAVWIYCGATFVATMNVLPVLFPSAPASNLGAGDPRLRLIFAGLYAGLGILVLGHIRGILFLIRRNLAVLALILLAVGSAGWSPDPSLTLRRGVALALTSMFGWFLAARYSRLEILRLLSGWIGGVLLASLFVGIVRPEYGIADDINAGAWQGVFTHKNELGRAAAFGAMLFLVQWQVESRRRWLAVMGLSLSLVLLLLSRSATSMIVVGTVALFFPLITAYRWRLQSRIPIVAMACLMTAGAAMLVLANLDILLPAIGRDTTLTGRTALWAAVFQEGQLHPWKGVGYSAFWIDWSDRVWLVQQAAGWQAEGAHSGYLDVWLELGLAGLALLFIAAFAVFRSGLRLLKLDPRPDAAVPVLGAVFVLLSNFTEGGLLRQNHFEWVVFVLAAAAAVRPIRVPRDPMRQPSVEFSSTSKAHEPAGADW